MLCLFQFHKGTIKTAAAGAAAGSGKLFQFHKGTIKTAIGIPIVEKFNISIP